MPSDDLAQFKRDAEAARQRGDSNTLARLLLMQFVLNCEAEEGRSNAFFSETLRHTFTRLERAEAALRRIDQWSQAYPLDVFPEPDFKRCHEVLKSAGLTLDSISASAMRHVVEGVGKIARAALPEEPADAG